MLDKVSLRGVVRLYEGSNWRQDNLIWQRENLVVTSGLVALANLLGNNTAGQMVSVMGFGSGNTAVTAADTALSTTPTYYNHIGTITIGPNGGVAAGSVQFAYSLGSTDYAANPLTIQELGLFGNTGGASFPAVINTSYPAWASGHSYSLGDLIVDSNGNVQRCTTPGTSAGAPPTWSSVINTTTIDNTVTWTLTAKSTAPTPMIAHVVVPSFSYIGGGNYSGTWTISM